MDSKIERLSKILLEHSVKLKKGEKILIEMIGTDCSDLACQIIKQAKKIGAIPLFNIIDYKILKELLINCNEDQIKEYAKYDLEKMRKVIMEIDLIFIGI